MSFSNSCALGIGYMPMPRNFPDRLLFLKGRPRHDRNDDFWWKHPPMDRVHRAKIFSPFDALDGFDAEIDKKQILYHEKKILSEDERDTLNEKIGRLYSLTYNSRAARRNRPQATIQYFAPCMDPHNDWYGRGGNYKTITGTIKKVDALVSRTLTIDDETIRIDDISEISFSQ